MKQRFNQVKAQVTNLQSRLIEIEKQVDDCKAENDLIEDANRFLISFSESIRQKLKGKLESLANMALKSVFPDKTMKFIIMGNRSKNGLHYDLYLETDGNINSLFSGCGGGVFEVIALALRISYLRILHGSLRQTMILDESLKFLDSTRMPLAIKWLKSISKEMNIQFIIITHIPELVETIDDSFQFKITNGETIITKKQP